MDSSAVIKLTGVQFTACTQGTICLIVSPPSRSETTEDGAVVNSNEASRSHLGSTHSVWRGQNPHSRDDSVWLPPPPPPQRSGHQGCYFPSGVLGIGLLLPKTKEWVSTMITGENNGPERNPRRLQKGRQWVSRQCVIGMRNVSANYLGTSWGGWSIPEHVSARHSVDLGGQEGPLSLQDSGEKALILQGSP